MSIPHNNIGPPPVGPPPPPNNGPPLVVRPNGQAPRSIEELCQPSIDGRGGPIAPIPIQATDFGVRHHMIQVQNTCQFHGLSGDDANRHIDKFLQITQHMKQNEVSDDALRLSLFPYSLTHHAIALYDHLPRNSIHSFNDMMRKFLSKYFPPSMESESNQLPEVVRPDGPTIPPTPSPLPKEVERETEATKDKITIVTPRSLILGRPFLRMARALIDVHGEEMTLRVNDEAITRRLHFGRDQEFFMSPEELSNLDDDYCDTEGDILYLEKLLNEDPSPTLPSMKNDDLKQVDVTLTKPSIEELLELELKDLPSHLEYAFF
ncbi:hypothetical protein Tco_0558073 [Tanacetum coccineum]